MLLRTGHGLVPGAPVGRLRVRVSGRWLPQPVLSLAQRLKDLPVGPVLCNIPLPTAVPRHGINLLVDTVAIGATAHFRQGNAWEKGKGQSQNQLFQHAALHDAGTSRRLKGAAISES